MQELEFIEKYLSLLGYAIIAILLIAVAMICLIYFQFNKERKQLSQDSKEVIKLSSDLIDKLQEIEKFIKDFQNPLAKDRVKELEALLGELGHDLASPLASLVGLAELSKADPEDKEAYVELFLDKINQIEELLSELRPFQSYSQNIGVPVDFEKIINDIINGVDASTEEYERPEIELIIDIKEAYKGDAFLIKTILHILIENAVSYQKHEAGERHHVKISVRQVNLTIRIMIADNGTGIEPEELENIFNSKKSLRIVKLGVDKLNGKIGFLSNSRGTAVKLVLPY